MEINNAELDGNYDIIIGNHNVIIGDLKELIGNNNSIAGNIDVLRGSNNKVTYKVVLLEGDNNIVLGDVDTLFGNNNSIQGNIKNIHGKNNMLKNSIIYNEPIFIEENDNLFQIDKKFNFDSPETKYSCIGLNNIISKKRTIDHISGSENLEIKDECCICLDEKKSHCFTCGHKCICEKCSKMMILKKDFKCPICRIDSIHGLIIKVIE